MYDVVFHLDLTICLSIRVWFLVFKGLNVMVRNNKMRGSAIKPTLVFVLSADVEKMLNF